MPITKRYEEQILLAGEAGQLLAPVVQALGQAGFKKISTDVASRRVQAQRKPIVGTLWGDITVALIDGAQGCVATVTVNAAVDNAFTLARSPGQRLLTLFRDALMPLVAGQVAPTNPTADAAPRPALAGELPSTADELRKLADLRTQGLLTDEEFVAAKARALSTM